MNLWLFHICLKFEYNNDDDDDGGNDDDDYYYDGYSVSSADLCNVCVFNKFLVPII